MVFGTRATTFLPLDGSSLLMNPNMVSELIGFDSLKRTA
jgi:hypothetical protein